MIAADTDVLIGYLAGLDPAAAARRQLERTGTPIGMADSLVAGIVLARNGALYTRSERHFGRVVELRRARQS
jgi:predicted nucleic acid-binding protein